MLGQVLRRLRPATAAAADAARAYSAAAKEVRAWVNPSFFFNYFHSCSLHWCGMNSDLVWPAELRCSVC